MRIVIAGIPGSGKTTVLTEALKIVKFDVINFGDVMFDLAKNNHLVTKRDDMRILPYDKQTDIQIKAASQISQYKDIIIDTHCTIKTPYGYLPGLPFDVLTKLQPNAIVLIETDPRDILSRRDKDSDIRKRDSETLEDMQLHQTMNRMAAMSYAVFAGATVKIIQNKQGELTSAAKEIAAIIR
jgi:adenylate kinase